MRAKYMQRKGIGESLLNKIKEVKIENIEFVAEPIKKSDGWKKKTVGLQQKKYGAKRL